MPRKRRGNGTPAPLCLVDDCDSPARSKGWCVKHYSRWYRTGSTDNKHNTKHVAENEQLRTEGKQRCTHCNRVKPFHLYHKLLKSRTGYRAVCKSCSKRYGKQNQRRLHLQNTYRISLLDYDRLKRYTNNKCWICGGGSKKNLAVDHNHSNDNVRGLLCQPCNRILGRWRDNPEIAARAAEYLSDDGATVRDILDR